MEIFPRRELENQDCGSIRSVTCTLQPLVPLSSNKNGKAIKQDPLTGKIMITRSKESVDTKTSVCSKYCDDHFLLKCNSPKLPLLFPFLFDLNYISEFRNQRDEKWDRFNFERCKLCGGMNFFKKLKRQNNKETTEGQNKEGQNKEGQNKEEAKEIPKNVEPNLSKQEITMTLESWLRLCSIDFGWIEEFNKIILKY
ncbi:hypothetical protein RFI_26067, partial [Reticulomyxa filosa]